MKIESLIKNPFVTVIVPSFRLALVVMAMTTVEMNRAEPKSPDMSRLILDSVVPPAEMAEKTSGPPFPRANNVTPARLSEQENLSEIVSSAGDKYASAVEAKLYIAIPRINSYSG